MAVILNSFQGKLNLDTQAFRIANGDYADALNITRDSPGEGQDVVVTNIIGNSKVSFALRPAVTYKVIGRFPDKIRNRVYYAVWNSADFDLWLYYDADTDTIVQIMENISGTGGEDVLGFDPSYRINHIDIIYSDTNGDMIWYTDGLNTPRKFNVSHLVGGSYTVIKTEFIEAAKAPFLAPPTCEYGSDASRNSNSLRRTLFQFCTRPVYDDYEKGVLFSFSKVPLPVGFYGSDNDIDNTKNNFITVTVPTGDENVIAVEIGMRYSIGNAWSDVVLVSNLNKEQLNLPNNEDYQYLFYNDVIYPAITDGVQYLDGVQSIPLFFWVPQTAFTQAMANGNVPVYGAITEGYNNFPINELDVTITAENATNAPPDADPPTLSYILVGNEFTFTVDGTVPTGTSYKIYMFFNGNPAIGQTYGVRLVAQYTSILSDTTSDVATNLYNDINSFSATPSIIAAGPFANSWNVNFGSAGSYVFSVQVVAGSSGGGGDISTEKTWMDDCPYAFGLVYFDEQGRDMPGVVTFSNPTDSDNDFLLTTPPFSLDGVDRQTPVITAQINHLAPVGAVKFAWVRRRLQYGNWVEYMTCDFQEEDGFYYFCLASIEAYKEQNSNFIYSTAPITDSGDQRIKIKAGITSDAYDGSLWTQDYQILGLATKTLTGGSSPDDDRLYVKVKIPSSTPSPVYQNNMLVMVYTPFTNPTFTNAVYYEWGETYDIVDRLHMGSTQDQTISQPAIYTWEEGDVYYHERSMYTGILGDPPFTTDTVSIIDENFSDFFASAVNDNGRAQVIEVNAQQVYNPVLYRFGGAYQSGTTVNNTPDFYFENQDEADRGWGDIEKFHIRNRYLYCLQKFKIGVIPVLQQIIRDTSGNPLEANSDQLLNKINYPFNEDIGIGDVPESFANDKDAMYGVDNYRGVVWRLSQDGIIKLSVLYETNSFFTSKLKYYRDSLNNGFAADGGIYTGDPTVYGCFNSLSNRYIIALEEISRYNSQGYPIFHQDGYTLTFTETRDSQEGFESPVSFKPEAMVSLDNLLITFKNGELWKHTVDAPRCNFYGVQYDAYITGVFNDASLEKKTWMAITELSSDVWECPTIETNVDSYGTLKQTSVLIPQNFQRLENDWHSAILRDSNSRGGTYNGAIMKGNYIIIKFMKRNASALIYLNGVSILFKDSPLTVSK